MAKIAFETIDQYIAAQPDAMQTVLERVRATIRKALPGAEEVISYGIPAYKLNGRVVLYFAGWKEHYSVYPATDYVISSLGEDVAPYIAGKGTFRFPVAQAVPLKLLNAIAKLRASEVNERAKAKTAAARK